MKTLEVQSLEEWRAWLAENFDKESEIWLVYYKKATGIPTIAYNVSVEDALCYGWVDSLIKRIDDQKVALQHPACRKTDCRRADDRTRAQAGRSRQAVRQLG